MEMTYIDFADWFRRLLGWPCPLPAELQPTAYCGNNLWASPSLATSKIVPPVRPEFFAAPREYILAGHWGHGVSSYALYYIAVTASHRVFFRLAFGGAYGDRVRDAAFAVGYLTEYVAFRARTRAMLERSTLIHDMGGSWAELTGGGKTQQLSDDAFSDPNRPGRFFALLEASLLEIA
jgi:hypothetical protein